MKKKMNAIIYFLVTSALFEMKTTGYVKTATQFDNIFYNRFYCIFAREGFPIHYASHEINRNYSDI